MGNTPHHLIIMKLVSTYKVTKQKERNTKGANTPCMNEMFVCHISDMIWPRQLLQRRHLSNPGYDGLWKVFHATSKTLNPVKVEIRFFFPHRANLSTNNSNLTWYIPDERVLFVCIWNPQVFTFVLILAAAHHVALMLTQNKHFL